MPSDVLNSWIDGVDIDVSRTLAGKWPETMKSLKTPEK